MNTGLSNMFEHADRIADSIIARKDCMDVRLKKNSPIPPPPLPSPDTPEDAFLSPKTPEDAFLSPQPSESDPTYDTPIMSPEPTLKLPTPTPSPTPTPEPSPIFLDFQNHLLKRKKKMKN